jgi:heptaprenyl diphosphate synthase
VNTKKLTTLAITVTLAMALSFLESQIPPLVAIPGVKLGLANIAVIFALYRFGAKEAAAVSALRVFLVGLLFGSFVSTLYSIAGAILSFVVMLLLRRIKVFSEVGVSVAGGVCHNIGQIAVACVLLETNVILYYLPFLLLSGTVAGVGVGVLSALLVRKLKI